MKRNIRSAVFDIFGLLFVSSPSSPSVICPRYSFSLMPFLFLSPFHLTKCVSASPSSGRMFLSGVVSDSLRSIGAVWERALLTFTVPGASSISWLARPALKPLM